MFEVLSSVPRLLVYTREETEVGVIDVGPVYRSSRRQMGPINAGRSRDDELPNLWSPASAARSPPLAKRNLSLRPFD